GPGDAGRPAIHPRPRRTPGPRPRLRRGQDRQRIPGPPAAGLAGKDSRLKSVLYISYDGMLEPLGQSQVLAYLEQLGADRPIHLLSFEKAVDWADADARARVQARMDAAGIHWHPRRYHKRPSAVATSWDIGIGILSGLGLVLRYRLRIVHARSYVAAVMALALKRLTCVKFVFD